MIWNQPGERGKIGDHGQDGRQGERGERGEAGPAGPAGTSDRGDQGERGHTGARGASGADEFEREVAHVTAEALAANRLRLTDRRLLIIFLVLVCSFVTLFTILDRQFEMFRSAVIANCEQTNATLEQIARTVLTNPARSLDERQAAADRLRSLQSTCPP